jgi:hypothetical protein
MATITVGELIAKLEEAESEAEVYFCNIGAESLPTFTIERVNIADPKTILLNGHGWMS